jgi:hypothetical protein
MQLSKASSGMLIRCNMQQQTDEVLQIPQTIAHHSLCCKYQGLCTCTPAAACHAARAAG